MAKGAAEDLALSSPTAQNRKNAKLASRKWSGIFHSLLSHERKCRGPAWVKGTSTGKHVSN